MQRQLGIFMTLAACGVLALATAAIGQDQSTQGMQNQGTGKLANRKAASRLPMDTAFATKAAEGGIAEVQLGTLAQQHAENPDVKAFGQRMAHDHTQANDQLKQIAASENITLPTGMNAKDQAAYDRLSKLNGAAFDRAYMKDMISDHRTDINEFRRESQHGRDAALKDYATKTLPTLEEHLRLAESTDAKLGKRP